MANLFFDTETCGFYGVPVTIQYAYDDQPINIWDIWKHKIGDTLDFIEEMCKHTVIGFNLVFDWFHICKIYTMFKQLGNRNLWPEDEIERLANLEPEARTGPCVKPTNVLDLFLYARKGPLQSTMDRKDIVIRKVPTVLALSLVKVLEERVKLDEIYFARRKDKYSPKWKIREIKGKPDFKNIVLSFKASSSLKAIALHVLKVKEEILHFEEVELAKRYNPIELGYAPFALAISKPPYWDCNFTVGKKRFVGFAWPALLKYHIDHWSYNERARLYASNDVKYTRNLWRHFGCPPAGDDDSLLSTAVAAVRWKGYHVKLEQLSKLRESASKLAQAYPTAARKAKLYITENLSQPEQVILDRNGGSTKRVVLEELARRADPCIACSEKGCEICEGKGIIVTEASKRAKNVLEARMAQKEVELYDKLLRAGRFHVSVAVIGTLSGRMAGADKLNPQGVKRTTEVRECFDLADEGYDLCGGDFAGFEVVLADAAYKDPALRKDLTTCDKCGGEMISKNGPPQCIKCGSFDGKKIHALFGEAVFPKLTYKQIKASKGSKEMDYYERSKRGVFSQLYGGNADTMARKIGIPIEDAKIGEIRWAKKYPGVAKARKQIIDMFCSMVQPGGIGSRVIWRDPADKIESLLGFPRYFTLENQICKILFDLANKPPAAWKEIKIPVQRRERIQTASGAVQSALYAAAFGIQGSNMRAAANHVIQSSGAQITKAVQARIWDLQPSGVNEWIVQPCNVHDEILTPTLPSYVKKVTEVVHKTVESFRNRVPLIMMEWSESMGTWADK
jgi:hypothetical protein